MPENQLPNSCLDCPNLHRGFYRKKESLEDERKTFSFNARCSLIKGDFGKILIVDDVIQSTIPVPSQCSIRQEHQPWNDQTMIPGNILIEIEGLEPFGSTQSELSLIERAHHVLVVRSRKHVLGISLDLVSIDLTVRKAVYRRK